jgi:peptidoglycan/LPS O-acetylase OafA/YrhL
MAQAIQKRRFSELDALRGIAALSVVLFHFTFGYDNGFNGLSAGKFYFKYGYLGVNLFFMISGFVIFMTLEKTKDTMSFVVSRFSRLYPAYWTAIILTVLLTSLLAAPIQKDIFSTRQVLINFTMLQSFFKIKDVDGAYWTLAVELTFYFWMWFIFKIKKLRYIEWFCLAWMAAAVIITAFNIPLKKYLNVIFILNHAPLFMAGILFYLLKKRGTGILLHVFIFTSLLSELYMVYAVKAVINRDGVFDIIPYLAVIIFYGTFYLFVYDRLAILSNKVLLFLGGISYSLYLVHENIGYAVMYWLKQLLNHQAFYIPLTIGVVIFLAYCINIYIEKPAMNMIRKYYKTKEETPVRPAPAQKTAG